MFDESGETFLPKDMHTKESPKINVPCIQNQSVMITKKVSSGDDELSDDQEDDHQSRSEDINSWCS